MSADQLLFFQSQAGFIIFKIGFLLVLFMIGVFLLVVSKQIKSMNSVITQPDLFPYLEAYALFLELVTIALFVIGFVIL